MGVSFQQTRDSIGSRDQTADQIFAGVVKEKVRVRVVNEVIQLVETDGIILDSVTNDGLDSGDHGLDGSVFIVEEVVRRQWNWKSYAELRESGSASGTITMGGVQINLTL